MMQSRTNTCGELRLADAGKNYCDIDAVAVTFAPGLIGALLVGVNFAKGLAMSLALVNDGLHHLHDLGVCLVHVAPN